MLRDQTHQLIRDTSPVGYLVLDDRLVIRDMLGAAEDLLQISASQVLGRSLESLRDSHPISENIERLLTRINQHKLASARSHGHIWGAQDRPIDLHVQSHDSDGWTLCTVLPAGRDSHELSGTAARKMLKGLSAMLAHEIKNPLAGIRASAQLLGRAVTDDKQHLSRLIAEEVDRVGRLIDGIAASGSLYEQAEGRALTTDIHDCAQRARALLPHKDLSGLVIEEYFDPSLPLVSASDDAIIPVLLNLLLNAVRAVNQAVDAGGSIVIATRYSQGRYGVLATGERVKLGVEVRISDTGIGIAPDLLPHIFEPFVTTNEAGSGMGLSVVSQILAEIGGQIEIASSTPAGTEFRLYLPEARDTSDKRGANLSPGSPPAGDAA